MQRCDQRDYDIKKINFMHQMKDVLAFKEETDSEDSCDMCEHGECVDFGFFCTYFEGVKFEASMSSICNEFRSIV